VVREEARLLDCLKARWVLGSSWARWLEEPFIRSVAHTLTF